MAESAQLFQQCKLTFDLIVTFIILFFKQPILRSNTYRSLYLCL